MAELALLSLGRGEGVGGEGEGTNIVCAERSSRPEPQYR